MEIKELTDMDYPTQADKFVWAYIIENGFVTTGEWNYYGGRFEYSEEAKGDWDKSKKITNKFRKEVKEFGVDWQLTRAPKILHGSAFVDTFTEAEDVESLLGDVFLKNGNTYKIGVGNAETRFTDYAKMLSEMAVDVDRVKRILGETA